MPIYEYKCSKCGETFEELITSNREKNVPCPKCSSQKTERLMSRVGGISVGASKMPTCASTCPAPNSCCSGGACHMH